MAEHRKPEKKSKKNLWIALGASVLVATLVLGVSLFSTQQTAGARSESVENLVSSDGIIRTMENCVLEQTYRFTPCGHTVTRRIQLPESLVGADFEQVQHYYHPWQVETFSPYSVLLSRDENIYCPMHYVLMTDETGELGVFQNVYGDGMALVDSLGRMIGEFDEDMREQLYTGIGFESMEAAKDWLRENGKS